MATATPAADVGPVWLAGWEAGFGGGLLGMECMWNWACACDDLHRLGWRDLMDAEMRRVWRGGVADAQARRVLPKGEHDVYYMAGWVAASQLRRPGAAAARARFLVGGAATAALELQRAKETRLKAMHPSAPCWAAGPGLEGYRAGFAALDDACAATMDWALAARGGVMEREEVLRLFWVAFKKYTAAVGFYYLFLWRYPGPRRVGWHRRW